MKTTIHKRNNKIMLAMSLVLFLGAGLILGVKALTIDTSLLNTIQVIKRIVISNTNSTATDDVLVDFNNDSAGTVYIKNKLGIGDSTPSAALQVSGTIIANQYCDSDGTTCTTIGNISGGTVGGITTEVDPIYNTGINGKLCMQVNGKIVCETDTSNGSVDTHLTTGEVITMIANSGYITSYTETDPVFLAHSGDYYTTGESDSRYLRQGEGSMWNTGTTNSINYTDGNVGIGTDTPENTLNISGILQIGSNSDDHFLRLTSDDIRFNREDSSYIQQKGTGGNITFKMTDNNGNLNSNMIINGSGNVGIGTTNPTEKLEVNGNTRITKNLVVGRDTLFVNSASNNVGIGTGTPTEKLEVNGAIKMDQTDVVCINNPNKAGTIFFSGGNFYGCTGQGSKVKLN